MSNVTGQIKMKKFRPTHICQKSLRNRDGLRNYFEVVVIAHNLKINARDKIKLKNFNPTHLLKNHEKRDVLIFKTIQNDCELYF